MLQILADPQTAETVALGATLLCVSLCAFFAFRVPASGPRLFLALALFGLNWGILLLYYLPGQPQNEILSAFSGFVLVYVGVLLLREERERRSGKAEGSVGWLDRLPLMLFRPTVGGFGVYMIARRLLHVEYGYGTLALAAWGTLLTVLGYLTIWLAFRKMFARSAAAPRVAAVLGTLLAVYAICEVTFTVWYARTAWPAYHRFLALESRRNAPDPETALPFETRPGWPNAAQWEDEMKRPEWPAVARVLSLKVEPRVPEMPLALKYAFALLKVAFTAAFFWLLWRRPAAVSAPAADAGRAGVRQPARPTLS